MRRRGGPVAFRFACACQIEASAMATEWVGRSFQSLLERLDCVVELAQRKMAMAFYVPQLVLKAPLWHTTGDVPDNLKVLLGL